jgi:tetratricopeptide (TPR) repeat protein
MGNSGYPSTPVPAARDDAKSMEDVLRRVNFDVHMATDTTRKHFAEEMDQFIARLQPNDVAVFYYSGHGVQLEGENYLLGVDFNASDKYDVRYDGYALTRIEERMERSGAALSILILDASRNNPFLDTKSVRRGLAPAGSGRGTFLAFSAEANSVSIDGTNATGSLFTSRLAIALETPGLTLDEVLNRVRAEVIRESDGRQVPVQVSSVGGTFYFIPPPGSADDAFRAGIELLSANKAANAIPYFDRAIGMQPAYAPAYVERALGRKMLGDEQHSHDDFEAAINLRPIDSNAYVHRALAFASQGRLERALTDLDRAVRLDGRSGKAHEYRGLVFFQLGEYKAAADEFDAAISLSPRILALYHLRGKARLLSGVPALAVKDFTRVIEERPSFSAFEDRANAYRQLGRYESVVADETMIINGQPGDNLFEEPYRRIVYEIVSPALVTTRASIGDPISSGYLARANAYTELKQLTLARDDLRKVSLLRPADAAIHEIIGSRFVGLDDYVAAETEFRTALAIDPDRASVLNAMGYMFAEQGAHLDEATRLIGMALKIEPNNAGYLDSLGWAYYQMNELELAERYLQQAVVQDNTLPEIHEHLGDVYAAENRGDDASKEWEEAFKIFERRFKSWESLIKSLGAIRDFGSASPEMLRLRGKLSNSP